MKIKFDRLEILCKRSLETITFSDHLTYIHGMISSGKSTIARLIDFCLGGELEQTPAIRQEFVSARLLASFEDNRVEFLRGLEDVNHVQVTWSGSKESGGVTAPIRQGPEKTPIWSDTVYNLTDLLYYLVGVKSIRVRKSKTKTDAALVRLSFRDLIWYCYLEQEDLDSSFYKLKEPVLLSKSRDVMRFVLGYYTEEFSRLNEVLASSISERQYLETQTFERRAFLDAIGYGSRSSLERIIEEERHKSELQESALSTLANDYKQATHQADDLREKLRIKSKELSKEEEAVADVRIMIDEQEGLKSELISSKLKHARFLDASAVLSGVDFERCPVCGQGFAESKGISEGRCSLCGREVRKPLSGRTPEQMMFEGDLDVRIRELSESIERHKMSLKSQSERLSRFKEEKSELDCELDRAVHDYDSRYLGRFREAERELASTKERISGLMKFLQMHDSVDASAKKVGEIKAEQSLIKTRIKEEEKGMESASKRTSELSQEYRGILLAVLIPGIDESCQVTISTDDWIPRIRCADGTDWSFYDAGSAGKKTMLKTCYALALHVVAARHNLPLPGFLIIDTPMKNISEDVNRDIFEGFYRHLYRLAVGPLSDTQIIIIDKEYIPPDVSLDLHIRERFMTTDDDTNPPLISYYRGS